MTTFNDVLVDGSADVKLLRVQANNPQTNALQTWEDSAATVLAQVTKDGDLKLNNGRLEVGDDLGATPDALIEAHRDSTSTTKPKRGIHSLGRITNILSDAINWAVVELELLGSAGVSTLQTAFRAKLTHNNTGNPSGAELRAGDFETINQTGTSGQRVTREVGVRGKVSNSTNAYASNAAGIEGAIANSSGGNISDAAAFEVVTPINNGTISNLYGVRIPDLSQGTNNYALHTGLGTVHLGDAQELKVFASAPTINPPSGFIKMYPKLNAGVPALYAKDSSGVERQLGGAGGSAADYILIHDQKASGSAGGTFTNGVWQTRTLNTEVMDTNNQAILGPDASQVPPLLVNELKLQPGTYECFIRCPAAYVGPHQARLQNITDGGITTLLGTIDAASNQDFSVTASLIIGRFTISAPKTFVIQHRCTNSRATDGFGRDGGFGTEIYTVAEFRRVG